MSSPALLRLAGPALLTRARAAPNAASTARLIYTGAVQQPHDTVSSGNRDRRGWLAAAAALLGLGAAGGVASVGADAAAAPLVAPADPYARPAEAHSLPSAITLYQYEVCPYCCKVRAFLDYHKLPYSAIEVNPLTKGELSWSSYKKVPVVKLDGDVVVDSSAIMSRLATDVAAARPTAAPAAAAAPTKKGSSSFFGGGSGSGSGTGNGADGAAAAAAAAAAALEHEVTWRKWVDEKFVKVLTANIYRNWDESVETFKYITDQTSWSWGTRELARWTGAVMMWQVGKRMPAKYGIEGDLRQALYDTANDFYANGLRGKRFAGGESPNLADLAAFGVLRAARKTGAFRDLMANSRLGPWFADMEAAVGGSARLNPPAWEVSAAAA